MPTTNSRLGYVFSPEEVDITRDDFRIWKSRLQSLGARWLILHASTERAVPESMIEELQDIQVEPIVFMPNPVDSLRAAKLGSLFRSYARWGLHYAVVYDRPNLRTQWPLSEWGRKGLVERFLDLTIPILEEQAEAGLQPVFPALEPGGDYWDTAFLKSSLHSLARRGKQDLLKCLALGVYVWTFGKPLDWGAGGAERWPEAKPYRTPPDSQDHKGFRIFEWYAQVAREVLQRELPLLVIAGGVRPQDAKPNRNVDLHTEQNLAIARAFLDGQIPDYVLNFGFYYLHSPRINPGDSAAWCPENDQPLPIVTALQDLLKQPSVEHKAAIRKPLRHYILLPSKLKEYATWQEALPYALSAKAVVGFSTKEARMAHQVTLFGDQASFDPRLMQDLRFAGCEVEHLSPETSRNEARPPDSTTTYAQTRDESSTVGGPDV